METNKEELLNTLRRDATMNRFSSQHLLEELLRDIAKRGTDYLDFRLKFVISVRFHKINSFADTGILEGVCYENHGCGIFFEVLGGCNILEKVPYSSVRFNCTEDILTVAEFLLDFLKEKEDSDGKE